MDRNDGQGQDDTPARPAAEDLPDLERSDLLRYLASLPEPTDSPCPDPTLEELLAETELPGGSDLIAAEARRRDPGPLTAQMLAVIRPSQLGAAGLLDAACAAERLASWTQATQHHYLAAFARPSVAAPAGRLVDYASAAGQPLHQAREAQRSVQRVSAGDSGHDLASSGAATHGRPSEERAAIAAVAYKVAAAEVSAALLVSPINANRRVAQAVEFTEDLPATLAALRDGVIDRGRALVIADRTQNLPSDLRRRVEAQVVPKATCRTAGQVRGIADRAVIAADPEAARKRHEAALARRGVGIRPSEDGMSIFRADLPADKSVTAFTVIDQIAMSIARRSAEKRPIGALRADVFTDIFDQLADHGSVHLSLPGRDGAGATPCSHQHSTPTTPPVSATPGAPTDRNGPAAGSPDPATDREGPGPTPRTLSDADADAPAPGIRQPATDLTEVPSPAAPPHRESAAPTDTDAPPDRESAAPTDTDAPPDRSSPAPTNTDAPPDRNAAAPTSPGQQLIPDATTSVGTPTPAVALCDCDLPGGRSPSAVWGLGTHQGRTTGLNVTIGATTLAGLDELPGELDGHGPIPADMARALAASAATITAVAVNPACGTALDLGRTTYRPRLAQRDRVVQRDGTCRFVGCRQPAWRCQIDHSEEFCPGRSDGGVTCPCNLACVCKFHHDLKTFGLWDTIHHPDDSITWISPIQRRYTSQPREWLTGMTDEPGAGTGGPRRPRPAPNNQPAEDPPPF